MKKITDETLDALSIISALFSYIDRKTYSEIIDDEVWCSVARLAVSQSDATQSSELCIALALPLEPHAHEVTQLNMFVAGMPLALTPVESLYKPWSTLPGGELAAQRGLYHGDSATHLASLYAALGIEIPDAYRATPDHLSLILDLIVMLLEVRNEAAARQVIADHLDWLGRYRDALDIKRNAVAGIEAFSERKKQDIREGMLFYRALIDLLISIFACSHNTKLSQSATARLCSDRRRETEIKKEEMHA